jgi:threonine aldolase
VPQAVAAPKFIVSLYLCCLEPLNGATGDRGSARPGNGIAHRRHARLIFFPVARSQSGPPAATGGRMNFASDNTAGVAPPILEAIVAANAGFALGYGRDDMTARVTRRLCDIFEREVAVLMVPTGTAANALALAHLSPPWGAVLCHAESHIITDECGAPEFFGGGLKLIGLPGTAGKITVDTLRQALARGPWGGPHHVSASVLSLTQATEAGTVYRVEEVRALSEAANAHGLAVNMDGARFANALARTNASPAQATWKAGVDVLSLGATKGGALAAEAVVFFDPQRATGMDERRKRAGHLLSKHRFIAAQFEAFLAGDLWLKLARHANAQADQLAARLAAAGLVPVWPVEANEVFVILPRRADEHLKAAGASYYAWDTRSLPEDVVVSSEAVLVRLVTSFTTSDAEIARFVEVVTAA